LARRRLGQDYEQLGYAFSFDGVHFIRSMWNPIGAIDVLPGMSAMAEAKLFVHHGVFYCFHTARWLERWITNGDDDYPVGRDDDDGRHGAPDVEDHENLGVQVFATDSDSFKLEWPVYDTFMTANALLPNQSRCVC
jgi:hypothetical protein